MINRALERRVVLLYGIRRRDQWLRGAVWTRELPTASRFSKEVAVKIATTSGGKAAVLPPEAFPTVEVA